ncbi:response regulator [Coraliomargarita akajimensis]|uniref:Response regulator receiver protein n=1 Tax=Coraliomargarita akajimensis (strain DSM 45221 / IAM 15411 / JCM 23193 / KCTC 12865 / 04OKA010-24) TaxID=583355 RepID=D5EKM4_CORAD|nr:response regulator [Coraliomargarita akajimensis]ADE54931.1 response regulator receiver protein [Coraliomargarita akajimensis DSM 45221]
MKILVAEDDLISRRLLITSLKQFGHEVVAFDNGQDAWDAYDENPFRIIISDWLMPGIDGLELCRKVRKRPETEYTYFILLTANAQGKDEYMEAMAAGIDDFLSKPMDRDQVWMRLKVAERILRYTTEISNLESMLPICSYCKKVRDDNNYWQQVESYILQRTGTSFSHSVCPSCYETTVVPQLEQLKKK